MSIAQSAIHKRSQCQRVHVITSSVSVGAVRLRSVQFTRSNHARLLDDRGENIPWLKEDERYFLNIFLTYIKLRGVLTE